MISFKCSLNHKEGQLNNIEILKIISDETRYAIINLLLSKGYCVRALAKRLKITEAAVSQHLSVLKKADIVSGEKKGYFMHYKVNANLITDTLNAVCKNIESKQERNSKK